MGTLKREALNHFVFVSEAHIRRTLGEFRRFHNTARPHQGIGAIPAEQAGALWVSPSSVVCTMTTVWLPEFQVVSLPNFAPK